MQFTTKTLRDYQEKLVFNVCRATEDVLVEQPTGSGKTVQIVTLVAMHLGKKFSHAVISAPQEQIEQGFVKRDYNIVAFAERCGVAVPSIQVPNKPVHKSLIRAARESGNLGSVKRIVQYLRQSGSQDRAWACTHAALNRLTPENLPDDLTAKALFIDEAHHASADGLSQIVTLWRERGGQLFFFTATPYRGDGRPVKLDGMRAYRRSLAEHMAEGFAPRYLDSEIVALGKPGDAITAAQFTGEEAPPASYFDSLVAAICRRWCDDGKPKAIVRVPPMQGGKSGELVRRLTQALAAENARVLDATGTGAADKQRFLVGLKAEQQQTFATSTFDVMIGIQRVLEGTDWPLCSAVYCVGMPGSLNTVVQFLGRAMRLKGPDYPAEQRDRAKLVFFVPCGGGAALTDLSIDHSRHALLTCCFLADHQVGQEWIVTQEVRRGIEAALGPRADNPAAADAENEADEPLDPQIRAEISLAIANAKDEIVKRGDEPTLGELMKHVAKNWPHLPELSLQRMGTEVLAALNTATGAAARKRLKQEIAKRLRIDPKVKQAMTAAFAAVLDEFRDATLKDSLVLESIGRQVHGVTGGQMREFAQRLRDAVPQPLTVEQILAWADSHHEKASTWPNVETGAVVGAVGETWRLIDGALRGGHRSLPGNSSLAQLLEEQREVRNVNNPPSLTIEKILGWADAYYNRTNRWPFANSGAIEQAPAETWQNVAQALRIGLRSLPGGLSLAELLAEHRGVRNLANLPTLSDEQILVWVDDYRDCNGEWPTRSSGIVNGATGETWAGIDQALLAARRGLAGGSSLAKLLAEHRGVRNIQDLPPLRTDQILAWADEHHGQTGEWPATDSGPVAGVPGETWMGIHRTLQKGHRGLPAGSSLAKFLAEHRDKRNHMDLPSLTIEMILAWSDSHHRRTGDWPRRTSGTLIDAPGEAWGAIDAALMVGNRGLPRNCSLARLLAEHRQVRNKKDLPHLTIDQILTWADAHHCRHGHWPALRTGPIEEAPGETWGAIDASLKVGRRGLPGGSSLARLIRDNRG
jgi:hypothetical protein